MPELGQNNFDLGWVPSVDARNAPNNGLLRMDNVSLDEDGALTALRGNAPASEDFGQAIRNIYSKRIYRNGVTKHYRYVHLADGSVYSNVGNDADLSHTRSILTGGNDFICAFGNAAGYTLIASGTKKKKDDGLLIKDLGIEAPTAAPTIEIEPNSRIVLTNNFGNFQPITETDGNVGTIVLAETDGISLRPNLENNRVVVRLDGSWDFANFTGIEGSEPLSPYDVFNIRITSSKQSILTNVQINFLTVPRPTIYDPNDLVSMFSYTFQVEGTSLSKTFNINRDANTGDGFEKLMYPGSALDWSDIKQIEIVVTTSGTSETDEIKINQGIWYSGKGNLSGTYQWIQVNGYKHPETGNVSVSPIGSSGDVVFETDPIQLNNERAFVTPQIPSSWGTDVNQIWIFRREISTFDSYYRSAVREDISKFADYKTDRQIIGRIGDISRIDDDRTIIPTRIDWFVEHPPDGIISIAGPYFGRTVYLTEDKIYLSKIGDPDAVDSRYTFDVSGNSSERNLWCWQVGDSALLIGTNIDIYELSGSMRSFEDGSLDAQIRPYSIDSPPITRRVCSYQDNLIYFSKEGWRVLNGTTSILLTGETRGLYNERDLYGFSQSILVADQSRRFDCTVSRSKLYCIIHHDSNITNPLDRERSLLVYDFQKKYWHATDLQPSCLWTEEHGVVLAGFVDGDGFDKDQILSLDRPEVYANQLNNILIRSPFLYGGYPDSRKDVETLKIFADTKNQECTVGLYVNGSDTLVSIGTFSSNGPKLITFDIERFSSVNLGRSFSLSISGANFTSEFKLFYWSINFTPRPEQKNYQRIPPTNFGVAGRKRWYDLPFSMDTLGHDVEVTPVLDGVNLTPVNITGKNAKSFETIAFPTETIGHEMGLEIRCEGNEVFEFYEMIKPRHTEFLPDLQKNLVIPFNNLGTPAKKRIIRFAIVIDTRGNTLQFSPQVDNVSFPPLDIRTTRKETVVYYFTDDVEGVDIGGRITGGKFFEFYDIDFDETISEKLPTPTKYLKLCSDLDQQARKRLERFSVVLNTRNGRVQFTAITDGVRQSSIEFNSGDLKKTYSQYFTSAITFVNLCWELKSLDDIPFEYYGFLQPEILEILPEPVKFLPIPATNLNNDKRKRFITYAIVIDTFQASCTLRIYINGVSVDSSTFSTNGKDTYIHYFTSEIIGTDIRAELSSNTPFEFYGINFDETISEILPAPAKFLVIPPTNYGIAAKKRIRTIPFTINTRGGSVRYTPSVDGNSVPSSDHNTTQKRTVLHYASTDLFGIDYGGTLESLDDTPFEFYGFETPENVQTLPVGKKYDQVGKEVHREAWLRRFEIRCVAGGTSIDYEIFVSDVSVLTGTITTIADVDKVYQIEIPKSIRGTIFRIEFSAEEVFHRYHVYLWYGESGGASDLSIVKFRDTE